MSTRVITPPSMDLNRDMSQNCPDGPPPPSVVAIPESGEGLPEGSATPSSLGCPSPACSPNSSSSGSTMFPMTGATEHILSMKIRTVPRCLFGPPDPRTAQFAREKVKEIYEQDKNRYNFDFDAEKPLEGPLKWEAVPVAPPTTTSSSVGSYAPKAYALSRFPFLSGSIDRGNVSPPRTTINNNQLPPARQLYFHPEIDREPLLVVRGIEQDSSNSRKRSSPSLPSTPTKTRPVESTATKSRSSSTASSTTSQVTSFFSHHRHHHSLQSSSASVLDPAVMLIPSPEASSCSSEDSAHVEMELGEEEEEDVATSVESSSTEDDMKISNVLSTTSNTNDPSSNSITGALSTSSGTSSRLCTSSSSSRASSISSSTRRTKSVSSSSPSSPSASPSSPTSLQPQITRYLPVVRKRPACTSTTKAASESAPTSSAAQTETKRAAM